MDDAEKEVVSVLAKAMMLFRALEQVHPSDIPEFALHIHGCQNIVMARGAVRSERNAGREITREHPPRPLPSEPFPFG